MRYAIHIGGALLCVATAGLGAQERALPDRITGSTRATLDRLLDSARTIGIPRAPLYDKVSEGVLKGADDERIVRAVQSLTRELGDARAALGPSADLPVLSAAASALHAGVSTGDLRRLAHTSSASSDAATLATALVTLVDLVAKRVPVGLATTSIETMIERRAGERQYRELRADVEKDVLAGRAPDAALATRMRPTSPTP